MKFNLINHELIRLSSFFLKWTRFLEVPDAKSVSNQLRLCPKRAMRENLDLDLFHLFANSVQIDIWERLICGRSIDDLLAVADNSQCAAFCMSGKIRLYYQNYYAVIAINLILDQLKLYRCEGHHFGGADDEMIFTFFRDRHAITSGCEDSYCRNIKIIENIAILSFSSHSCRTTQNDNKLRKAFDDAFQI